MPAAASKDRYKCERALFSKCLAVREQLDSPSSPPLCVAEPSGLRKLAAVTSCRRKNLYEGLGVKRDVVLARAAMTAA